MAQDPGYGPNGERLSVTGRVSWRANAPPKVIPAGDDQWGIYALGLNPLPAIDQNDDEVFSSIYLGGV